VEITDGVVVHGGLLHHQAVRRLLRRRRARHRVWKANSRASVRSVLLSIRTWLRVFLV
jgi:hypothetical protein